MVQEIWRPVVGYEGYYSVSNLGRIRNDKKRINSFIGRILKPGVSPRGYEHVVLSKEKHKKNLLVHRVVAMAFLNQDVGKTEVNHIDGKKLNNRLENLEFVSSKENVQHAVRLKLKAFGSRNGFAKLTEHDIYKIFELHRKGMDAKRISYFFRVSNVCILNVINRKSWKHVQC